MQQRRLVLRFAEIQAHEDAQVVLALVGGGIVLIDLVLVPKTLAGKGLVDGVAGVIDPESPGSAGTPGVTVEDAADHGEGLGPVVEVIARSVDSRDSLAGGHEIHDGLAVIGVRELEASGAVEEDQIVVSEIGWGEDAVVVCQGRGVSPGFLAHGLQGKIAGGDGSVDEPFAEPENEDLARRLGRNGGGFRDGVDHGLFLGLGEGFEPGRLFLLPGLGLSVIRCQHQGKGGGGDPKAVCQGPHHGSFPAKHSNWN